MTTEAALPTAPDGATAGVQDGQPATDNIEQQETQTTEDGQQGEDSKAKPEKTPEQREIERLRRGIDRKTRQLAEERAARAAQVRLPEQQGGDTTTQDDDQSVTLSRSQLDAMINERAAKLAPTIKQEEAVMEQRRGVVQGLAKQWGAEKFDAYASDLDDSFGGLAGKDGKPKPATDAIFESAMPAALIEYLTDPDNSEEAESLGKMGAVQAARAIVRLEIKLEGAAKEAKEKAKPQASNAAAPIEPVRGGGTSNDMPDPANTKAYMKWANEQERRK